MVGDITFENVSFRYGSRKDVFKELGLKIEKGKTTAIVGERRVGQDDFDFVVTAYLSYTGGSHSHRRL